MEIYTVKNDKDSRYPESYERRRYINRERKQRIRKKRMLRRLLFLVVHDILILLIVAAIVSCGKSDDGDIQPQAQKAPMQQAGRTEVKNSRKEEGLKEETNGAEERQTYHFTQLPDADFIDSEEVVSTHAILVDESRNVVIASKGADERISPVSMTKVLTVLVAAEHIPEEDLDDTFTMTLEITDYAYINDCSSVDFLDGETVTVRDLFYGTALPSGGDAAVGLATYTAGSHEAFVDMMNDWKNWA